MPLMSLAATAIDQPKSRQKVTDTMLQYLDTDAICCREEPGKLANLQAKVCTWLPHSHMMQNGQPNLQSSANHGCAISQMYNPVLTWANQHFDVRFVVSNSIFGASQHSDTHQAVRRFLEGML